MFRDILATDDINSSSYVRRELQSSSNVESCDEQFLQCLADDKCVSCFMELDHKAINWAGVAPDTACDDVVSNLVKQNYCVDMSKSSDAKKLFCDTFDICIIVKEPDDRKDEKPAIDCDTLTECNWDGFDPTFLGDGACQDKMEGCYNSRACDWDGGDCCPETCESKKYIECGHDGFACRDPKSPECDPLLTNQCDPDLIPHHDSKIPTDCTKTLYRLIMYDSFGDGWDETKIKITAPSLPLIYEGGLKTGSMGTEYLCLDNALDSCYHVTVKGGVWGNEISWEIKPMTEGAPALTGGGIGMDCDFSLTGRECGEKKCSGKPNILPSDDPEYKDFKNMFECIEEKCPVQVGACHDDAMCSQCFGEDASDYCYGIDKFNAVVDCTLCSCTENKGSDFCTNKRSPGAVVPPSGKQPSGEEASCTPLEIANGGAAVLRYSQCTKLDQVALTIPEFDQNNFGALDVFEACAHNFNEKENHGGHTALGCLKILEDAKNAKPDNTDNKPGEIISAISKLLYDEGEEFCDCAKVSSEKAPLCSGFIRFKSLMYESLDACQALDEIDCDAWNEFYGTCKQKLVDTFGSVNLSRKEQCDLCDSIGHPVFRRLDCGNELPKDSWDFYSTYSKECLGAPVSPTPVPPVNPAPAPKPTPSDSNYVPVVPYTPPTPSKPNYVPSVPGSNPKPYEPYTPSGSKSNYQPSADGKKSRWFWKLVLVGLLVAAAYHLWKRRQEFSFVRYRRARNWGGDSEMYSGLSMESSSVSFQPPSLPPPPQGMM